MKPRQRWGWRALALLAAAAGCGDDEKVTRGADAGVSADAAPPVDAVPPSFSVAPLLEMAPNADTPLVGLLTLETDRPTSVAVRMDDGASEWIIEFDGTATEHDLTVLGFRPGRTHEVTVIATDEAGVSATETLTATTDPLPDDVPDIEVLHADESMMEPGLTMFRTTAGAGGYVLIVNAAGEVVWYHHSPSVRPGDVSRMPDGNLVWNTGDFHAAVEIDMAGNVVQRWHASNYADRANSTAVATDAFHHEFFPMENGNFVAVSTELKSYDDYPTSELDPTPRSEPLDVVGDVFVEFERDGTIAGEWKLLDMIDPYRVGYDSFGGFWNGFYGGGIDWSHANAVIHDPSDDTFITSLRHQDAVIKFRRSGELVWILGPHENWGPPWDQYLLTPTDPNFLWNYHQHAPAITPNGILLFDNGVYRASPPDPKQSGEYSRAMEVSIDETNMEVSLVWQYTANTDLFSNIVGDADWMPTTGNVLIDFGAHSEPGLGREPLIIEVTHTDPPVEVFRLRVDAPDNGIVYRADRIPGLYP